MGIIPDGKGTTLEFTSSGLVLENIGITPPAVDGGEAIEVTHLGTSTWREYVMQSLKMLDEFSFTAHFDPTKYAGINQASINVNQEIKITFPNGENVTFWGGLRRGEPAEISVGEKVNYEGTVKPTCRDNSGAEQAPVYAAS